MRDGEVVVKRHANFTSTDDDPLELWKIVKFTHLVSSSNSDAEVIKLKTRMAYDVLMMGKLEKASEFKGRFDYEFFSRDSKIHGA